MEPNRWLGVELRHLAALQAVAEECSFGRAAVRLGYTQSAVSQQIAMLERIVGAQLVERPGGPRAVSVTEAGRLLLRHADAIMARLRAAQADLAAVAEGHAGALRVGTYQSVGARILPELLRSFSADWPTVEVELTESASDPELLECVERGELDLAFAMLPLPDGPFEHVELMRDPYVLLVPAGSSLAAGPSRVPIRALSRLRLIGNRLCRSVAHVEAHLRSRGVEPHYVFHSDDNGTVQGLVAADVGAALVPRLTVDPNDDRVAMLDLGASVPPRVIAIAWHRDRYRSAAAHAFVEAARELCAGLELGQDPASAAVA